MKNYVHLASATSPTLTQGHTNLLEAGLVYADLRPRVLRILVHALRNETDPANLQLVLGTTHFWLCCYANYPPSLALCYVFCEESARYDLVEKDGAVLKEKSTQKRSVSDVIAERQDSDSEESSKRMRCD